VSWLTREPNKEACASRSLMQTAPSGKEDPQKGFTFPVGEVEAVAEAALPSLPGAVRLEAALQAAEGERVASLVHPAMAAGQAHPVFQALPEPLAQCLRPASGQGESKTAADSNGCVQSDSPAISETSDLRLDAPQRPNRLPRKYPSPTRFDRSSERVCRRVRQPLE